MSAAAPLRSLWAGDLASLILHNRAGLEDAWQRAMAA
jgi:hypothetical protein